MRRIRTKFVDDEVNWKFFSVKITRGYGVLPAALQAASDGLFYLHTFSTYK